MLILSRENNSNLNWKTMWIVVPDAIILQKWKVHKNV